MKKWTKKPVTITAVQWHGDNLDDVLSFVQNDKTFTVEPLTGGELAIKTLEDGANGEAKHVASVGDVIIRGVKGEYYACKPDIFGMTYMPAGSGDKEVEDVRAFQKKFDILNNDKPTMLTKRKLQERIECMQEELDEFKKAVAEQNFEEQADALIDLVYFAKGTAVMMGLPWADLWDDVQRANMSKERGVGKRGHAVDMIKPQGWKKPDGLTILKAAGFRLADFTDEAGNVDEDMCADDAFRKVAQQIQGDA